MTMGEVAADASILLQWSARSEEWTSDDAKAADAEIVALVTQRESARRQRDYGAADALRERLRAGGVSLLDKEKLWSTLDGRRGTFATEVPTVLQAEPPADAPAEAAEAGSASGPQSAADTADGAAEPSANNPRYRGD